MTDHLHSERTGWRALAVAGLLLTVAALVLTQVLAGVIIPPLAVFAAVFLVLAILVQRIRSRWPLIVAVIAAVAFTAVSFPFLTEDLPHPASTGSFVPAALNLLGIAVAVIGGLMALLRPRVGGHRGVGALAGVLAVVVIVWSFVAGSGTPNAERQDGDVVVVAENTDYPDVAVPAGGSVYVENRDLYRHTFSVEGTDIEHEVPAQASVRFDLDLDPGSYRLFCTVAGHETMEGTLTVSS